MTRSRKQQLIILSNSLAGKVLDIGSQTDGFFIAWDETNNQYVHVDASTLFAAIDHDHEIGYVSLIFENALV
jgi:hypothetical protein